MPDYYRICPRCNRKLRAIDNFHKSNSTKDGFAAYCKDCVKKYRRKHYLENKEKIIKQTLEWRSKHIEIVNEKAKIWKANNPGKVKKASNKYKEKYPEKQKESSKKWISNNREKRRIISRRACAKLKKTTKGYLNHKISNQIRLSIGRNKNRYHWESLVNYTVDDLKKHLEGLFVDGMSWDNRSEWHIDHKIPISAFNFEKPSDMDFKKCWALSNLQPLWAKENLQKNNKLNKPFQPSLIL